MLKILLKYIAFPAVMAACLSLVPPMAADAQETIPEQMVQTQFEDFMFPAIPNYGIMAQQRVVTDVVYSQHVEGMLDPQPLTVTGNYVGTYYSYLKDDDNNYDRIMVVNHYLKAISAYNPEKLFQDEYNYYGRFTKDGKEFYIMVLVYSKGKEYEVGITEKLL